MYKITLHANKKKLENKLSYSKSQTSVYIKRNVNYLKIVYFSQRVQNIKQKFIIKN